MSNKIPCRGCGLPLVPQYFSSFADGCPCNSRRGINHGLVPKHTCTCSECDPEQTGAVRQPPPEHNSSTPIWELVIADMKTRDQVGRKRYGTPLQANNGRDALQDAYEEALDLCVYLKQAIVERSP